MFMQPVHHPLRTALAVLRCLLRPALFLVAVLSPGVALAQGLTIVDVSKRALANRGELTALADSLGRELSRPGLPNRRRLEIVADQARQRQRLATGDLVPGDKILLRYTTDSPRQDTAVVSSELVISLPGIPAIRMVGVLWSEVEDHLREQLRPFVRNTQVSAVPLVSIGVLGAVARPGYYLVPITAPISEAIMVAGGPTTDAAPDGIAMKHAGRDRWNRATMIAASQNQLSLASLGAANGDVLLVTRASLPMDRGFLLAVVGLMVQGVLIVTALP